MTWSVPAVGAPATPVPDTTAKVQCLAGLESQTRTGGPGQLGPPYDQYITSDFLGPSSQLPPGRKIYLIVLNYCLPAGLLHVWPLASFRICADGGSNRLYDELPSMMPPPPEEVTALEDIAKQGAGVAAAAAAAPGRGPDVRNGAGSAEGPSGAGSGTTRPEGTGNSNGADHPRSGNGDDPHHRNGVSHTEQQRNPPPQWQQHPYHQLRGPAMEHNSDLAASLRLAYLPDVVLGDLDSLRPDVRQYYVGHGVPFMDMSYDQDSNDLAKCIALIEERFIGPNADGRPEQHRILVLGALGGRLDHTLANLNALHMFPHLDVTLWGDGNLVRLVRPGRTLIVPDERFEGPTCGLIPIAGPVTATSSGLKWNVAATQLRVGGLVSSSNLLTGTAVEVAADGPLLWSTEVRQEPRPDLGSLWKRTAASAAAVRKREAEMAARVQVHKDGGGGAERAQAAPVAVPAVVP